MNIKASKRTSPCYPALAAMALATLTPSYCAQQVSGIVPRDTPGKEAAPPEPQKPDDKGKTQEPRKAAKEEEPQVLGGDVAYDLRLHGHNPSPTDEDEE